MHLGQCVANTVDMIACVANTADMIKCVVSIVDMITCVGNMLTSLWCRVHLGHAVAAVPADCHHPGQEDLHRHRAHQGGKQVSVPFTHPLLGPVVKASTSIMADLV